MASLLVIQGADQGKRFEFTTGPVALGRDNSNAVQLHDNEVSRRHAELRSLATGFEVVDLGSANGTYVNDRPIDRAPLRHGDKVQVGQTVILFQDGGTSVQRDLRSRVDLLARSSPDDHSAILRSIPSGEGSRVLQAPDAAAAGWLRERLMPLSIMYRATQAISNVLDIDALSPQILDLVFESIHADRGAILLKDESGQLVPKAVRWGDASRPDERMTISRTIVEYVLEQGEGVITTDAPSDKRFSPAQSIVDYQIREAICVPIQGRHTTLGVIYADIQAGAAFARAAGARAPRTKFTQDQLMLMVAIGHQAGLAIENTQFYNDKIEAERLAAVGQTIATLSHHIKNILQGIRSGSYLIDLGLNEKDESIVRRGWAIVEKNQTRIYNLVMDMLSFSKDREPALEPADLNETILEVVELMQPRATELGVVLECQPGEHLGRVLIDPEGIHRAVLNIVTNAIDASEGTPEAKVVVRTEWDDLEATARVVVADNGPGLDEADIPSIFQIFASTKGSRGTGLGLPVSQKIIREHGGRIVVKSRLGEGASFIIELPMSRGSDSRTSAEGLTMI